MTTFPASLAYAHSWNRSLVYEASAAVAKEHRARGYNGLTAPTTQPLGRSAYGGRNGETFGPDNWLNGQMTGRQARAIFDQGVMSGGKHFLLNEQETNRKGASSVGGRTSSGNLTEAYSSNADDKTIHETYAWSFYDAIKNNMAGVMCAMNKVNETYSCENEELLMDLLKSEIGFPGLVYGDVGGQHTAFGSFNGGLDSASAAGGSSWTNDTIVAGLNNGTITTALLNDKVIRNVIGWYMVGQADDDTYPSVADAGEYVTPDPRAGHAALAREFAAETLVLLKNTNNALPLNSTRKVAIFGYHAGFAIAGPNTPMDVSGDEPSVFPGHMAQVGGSGQGSFSYLATPLYAFTTKAMETGMMLRFQLNDTVLTSDDESSGMGGGGGGYSDSTAIDRTTLGLAYNQDACVVFINAYAGEGGDRSELYNEDQDTLVNSVASNCNNTIVVVNSNGPRVLDGFATNTNVTAIVYGGALGQESGNAILDVLYGDVNPSGRLAHTIAKSSDDYPVPINWNADIDFTEGNYIDWKYFDKYNVTPRYEFGYGLSYTTFEYGSAVTASSNVTAGYATGARAVGGREDLWDTVASVTATVSNTGDRDGSEVAQLYIAFPEAADMPLKNLRGFEKVHVAAGGEETVTYTLQRRDLSHWDTAAQEWKVEKGTYTLYVGASSRQIKAQTTLVVV